MTQVLDQNGNLTTTVVSVNGGAYHHVQGVASALWTINHNLGFRPGGVHVEDGSGTDIEAGIAHTDENTLTLTFDTGAISGDAYLS